MAEFRINVTVDPTKAEAGAKRVRGALDRTTKNADRLRATLVRAFAVLGGAAIGTAAIRAIRDYDTALIGVGKTTGILGPQLEALGRNVNAISRTVPVAVGELLEIAQAAGQLGIQGSANIEKFTRTVAQLGIASNLRGSEAATTLARFLSVTQTEVGSVDRLGSVIVRLGNNFAATEREIALAATRIAQTTALFRPMAHEVAGLATAVRALGLRAELASTAISRSFIQIDQTIRGGGQGLQDLAEITRTSADALGGLFANDPTEVFVRFLEGLSRVEAGGGDVVATLEKFNITGIESTQVLGTLATRTDLVRDALRQAGDEWQRNTALTDEANTAATSLGARFQFLASAVTDIFLALGESGGENIIGASVDALTAAARAIADNIDLALDAAVAFTAALAVPKIAAITASLAGAGAAAGAISAGLTAAAAAARVLGRALVIGFAIEAITVVVEELQELNDVVSRTPATWADAATVAADRFANNLVGGLVAVARGINNTIRLNRLCTWLRFDQHAVGKGFCIGGEAEERAESSVAGFAAVEAKDELIEIGLQMLATQPVVDASRPSFEVGEDLVDPGQDEVSGGLPDDMDIVAIGGDRSVAGPAVGFRDGVGIGGGFDEVSEVGGAVGGDFGQPQAAWDVSVPEFDGADDEHLAVVAASLPSGGRIVFGPEWKAGLVDFHQARQRVALGVDHAGAQLVGEQPSAAVRADTELFLELQGRDAVGVGRHQVGGPEPDGERQLAGVQDRPGRHRGLPAAAGALEGVCFSAQRPALFMAARGTDEAVRPAHFDQPGGAGVIVREHVLEGEEAVGDLFHVVAPSAETYSEHSTPSPALTSTSTSGGKLSRPEPCA